ncbi:hypothetical protein ACLGIH_01655 [Streptomyces sp. HMX87]|uniref:hypothetical protein n=1 Tax=Streptomyces sp. HMX87 TaxID=3390849 RepID=UPI003A8A971E
MGKGFPVVGGGTVDPAQLVAKVEPLVLRVKDTGVGGQVSQEMVDQARTVEDLLKQLDVES